MNDEPSTPPQPPLPPLPPSPQQALKPPLPPVPAGPAPQSHAVKPADSLATGPMGNTGILCSITSLLRSPGRLAYEFSIGESPGRLAFSLLSIALLGLTAFGLTAGSMSGADQYLYAPLKIAGGTLLAALICLPSLFIFTALSGAEVKFSSISGLLMGMIALTALLLAGFTPVVWVFTQSTDSVAFVGAIMLVIWFISMLMGMGFLRRAARLLGMTDGFHLNLWLFIFTLVSLQMSCALRPILGTAETQLPTSKKFFLQHWSEQMKGPAPPAAAEANPAPPGPDSSRETR